MYWIRVATDRPTDPRSCRVTRFSRDSNLPLLLSAAPAPPAAATAGLSSSGLRCIACLSTDRQWLCAHAWASTCLPKLLPTSCTIPPQRLLSACPLRNPEPVPSVATRAGLVSRCAWPYGLRVIWMSSMHEALTFFSLQEARSAATADGR
jgi:hypothetical protein